MTKLYKLFKCLSISCCAFVLTNSNVYSSHSDRQLLKNEVFQHTIMMFQSNTAQVCQIYYSPRLQKYYRNTPNNEDFVSYSIYKSHNIR